MTLLDRSPDQPERGMRDDGGLLFERDEEPVALQVGAEHPLGREGELAQGRQHLGVQGDPEDRPNDVRARRRIGTPSRRATSWLTVDLPEPEVPPMAITTGTRSVRIHQRTRNRRSAPYSPQAASCRWVSDLEDGAGHDGLAVRRELVTDPSRQGKRVPRSAYLPS